MARSSRYLFYIVEEVNRRNMPTELALLPFVESAFNPEAKSTAKAMGIWQFMPRTGQDFKLTQNVFRDERRDVLQSTNAALDYLQRLYKQFGDWQLALAAYNWGEGNVAKAIKRNQAMRKPTDYESLIMPRETRESVVFRDLVYGEQSKATADMEDFALLRSSGVPTYHMASCADDADLNISHIIRGQDHLTNTFKHVLIFEALGAEMPQFAHLPLLIAPDGAKLSKRKHGPVVSVTTYRDAGFLPHTYVNFLCLLGWSPKNDRESMTREELIQAFKLEGVNRSNATVNFTDESPIDPKALWLNGEKLRQLPLDELATELLPFAKLAGFDADLAKMRAIAPLIQERIPTLRDVATTADFFFAAELPPYDINELIPQKGDLAMAKKALQGAKEVLASVEFSHDALDAALRAGAQSLGLKPGQMFQPIRVAVCGRKVAPPLFETLAVLGRETSLHRIGRAIELLP